MVVSRALAELHLCSAGCSCVRPPWDRHTPEQQFCLITTSVTTDFRTLPYSSSSCSQPSTPGALVPLTSVPTAVCSLFLPGLSLTFYSPGSALHISLKHALACHFHLTCQRLPRKEKNFEAYSKSICVHDIQGNLKDS